MIGAWTTTPRNAGAGRAVRRLDVIVVGADIADMRKGEGDDLARIGRIGQDLLIAGHGGVEADLADGFAGRAEPGPFEDEAVGEHEQRASRAAPARNPAAFS